jgi:hypothetical protein
MARELADVIHYFLEDPPREAKGPEAPLVACPVGEKDAVRLAFVWNLAVELARNGVRPTLVAPEVSSVPDLLPAPAVGGVLAPELVLAPARTLAELARSARAPRAPREEALRIALFPVEWIEKGSGSGLLAWTLLFAGADPGDLDASLGLARRIAAAEPGAEVGVALHGVESVAEAEAAFADLAGRFEAELGRPLRSYGLLLDDLLVYRAVVERRPVVLSHPQSLAARALTDVARLLLGDARAGAPGAVA